MWVKLQLSILFLENKAQNLKIFPATTGVKNYFRKVDVPGGGQNGKPAQIRLDLWDTAGGELYLDHNKVFFCRAHAVVFVYSINNARSFKDL